MRYATQRTFSWSAYVRGKTRVLMPFQVRMLARKQRERQAALIAEMMAAAAQMAEQYLGGEVCGDPECESCQQARAEKANIPTTLQ